MFGALHFGRMVQGLLHAYVEPDIVQHHIMLKTLHFFLHQLPQQGCLFGAQRHGPGFAAHRWRIWGAGPPAL